VGGSEQSIIRVVEVRSGKILPDAITRCRMGHIAWHPDGRSFFYLRLNALPPGAPPSETLKRSTTFRHVLFTHPDTDEPVLGQGFSARVPLADIDFPHVFCSPGSEWLFGVVNHGAQRPISLYAAPLASLAGTETPLRKVVDPADEVDDFAVRGDELFLLSSRGAPRFRILSTSMAAPDLSGAQVVVPETADVITDLAVAEDGLYFQEVSGGPMRLWRLPSGGRQRG
jgi:prolyl oligopeptidase